MTLREAVYKVMSEAKGELHYKEVWDRIERRHLFVTDAPTPWQTVGSYLYEDPTYRKTRPGHFVLSGRRRAAPPHSAMARRSSGRAGGTLLDAIVQVLSDAERDLHYREIWDRISTRRFFVTDAPTPWQTVGSYLYKDKALFRQTGPGMFRLKGAKLKLSSGAWPGRGRRLRLEDAGHTEVETQGTDADTDSELSPELRALDGRISRVELRLRDVIGPAIAGDPALLPSHVAQKVNERLRKAGQKHALVGVERTASLATRLEQCDLRELEDAITNSELWCRFAPRFVNKEILCSRFEQIAELRNCFRHVRTVDEIALKEGEAAVMWFERILKQ